MLGPHATLTRMTRIQDCSMQPSTSSKSKTKRKPQALLHLAATQLTAYRQAACDMCSYQVFEIYFRKLAEHCAETSELASC